jgi:hypothetical protein
MMVIKECCDEANIELGIVLICSQISFVSNDRFVEFEINVIDFLGFRINYLIPPYFKFLIFENFENFENQKWHGRRTKLLGTIVTKNLLLDYFK